MRRGDGRRGRWGFVAALAVGLAAALPARGAGIEVENLRVGFASPAQNNLFKVGTWTPVWVQVRGGDERLSGVMEVEVPDDDGTPTFFRQPIDVPERGTVVAVAYARPGARDPNFTIRFRDERGRRRGPAFDGASIAQLTPILPGELILLTLGKPSGVELIPKVPGFGEDRPGAQGGAAVTVAGVDVTAGAKLPARWYGYDAAEAIVVDTNDRDLMTELSVRGQALADWVARGGHLVVAVGGNWQSARDSVLGPLLPGLPAGQERMPSLDVKTLDTFAGATRSIAAPEAPPVQVTKLEDVERRGGKVLSAAAGLPLVVRGPYGFGRVTLVALDVDQKPFASWADRAQFWVRALDLRRPGNADSTPTVRLSGGGRRFSQSGVSDLATELRQALEQFPGIRLIPFGWVAFFIFVYILLIGPGDYLFLKKVVKRMELTWVTFPLIVLSVSLAAYFGAYVVKGRDLRVNKIDVLDVDQANGRARGSTFFNLFSPQNRDYDLTAVPVALDDPGVAAGKGPAAAVRAEPSASGAVPRPRPGTEVLVTWLGVPEPGFGGMGNTSRIGFSSGGYVSEPPGGSEALSGVRVPIWSTKLLTARWFGPAPARTVDADLVPVGTDRLAGTVTNRLDLPVREAILAFGKHVYQLGDLAPGVAVRVELQQDRQLSGLLRSKRIDPESTAPIVRANLALALMFHGSQGTTSGNVLASDPLHYLDLTGQLALDRPMLVGRLDRPAATLVLGNAPAEPKVAQTTMLRVILPLKPAS